MPEQLSSNLQVAHRQVSLLGTVHLESVVVFAMTIKFGAGSVAAMADLPYQHQVPWTSYSLRSSFIDFHVRAIIASDSIFFMTSFKDQLN